ncbi:MULTISPECIES: 2-dehydropantoate 2-reductase [Bacillus]|uniref:2-dehydropantoate 2-reductase n=1 Tax=Bacillus TaxID=1386 RepID=UPI0003153146|nr:MULTISPECIES: 2-dehydropantoate 2-reductase [Bacillus]
MKIGVIGGGAIGLLLSSYFAKEHTVTIYTRTEKQAKDLSHNGLSLVKNHHCIQSDVSGVVFPHDSLGEQDLIVVAVKQYHLNQIIPSLENVDCRLLFIQNGMRHLSYIESLTKRNEVYLGIVEHGALKKDSCTVVHTGDGVLKVASYMGNLVSIQYLADIPSFPVIFEEDYYKMLSEKLIVNAVINPLTAILGVTNGSLLDNMFYKKLFHTYFNELSEVLQFENKSEILLYVEEVCKKTSKNRSSMLRDLEENRPTEIDAILGYILDLAKKKQLNTPISENLYLMVKGKELQGKEK